MTGAVPCHEPEANEARSQPTPHRSNQSDNAAPCGYAALGWSASTWRLQIGLNNLPETTSTPATQPLSKRPLTHRHSYWLKYLLLKTINSSEEPTRVGDIIEMFVNCGGYEEHLVRHVLGSLASENEFYCLISRRRSLIDEMRLTDETVSTTKRVDFFVSDFAYRHNRGETLEVDLCSRFFIYN